MTDPQALRLFDPALLDNLPCMLLCLAPDGSVLQSNRAFTQLLGNAAQASDTPAALLWPALLKPESHAALMAALSARGNAPLQLSLQPTASTPIGTWLDGQLQWLPEAAHYLCVLHDVTTRAHNEQTARAHADKFQLLADNMPVLIAYFEAQDLRCLFANKRYAHTFGLDEQSILGRTVQEIIGEAATREIQPHIDSILRAKIPAAYERQLVGRDGQTQWVEVNLLPHLGPSGDAIAAFVLITDITERRQSEQVARDSQERLHKFMHASAEGMTFHQEGVITDVNPAACAIVGYTLEEMLGRKTLDFVAPDQRAAVANMIRTGAEAAYESALLHKDGRRLPVELMGRTMVHAGERVRMTIVRDIRERYAAQEHIRHLAHHDALTGLPNRLSLMEHLEHLIATSRRADAQFALLFIDLDHFKRVNDSLGHLVGDTLLQTVARRITDGLRTTDRVARFGGDEFIVLLPKLLQRVDAEEVAHKLLRLIEAPVNVDGRTISVTPSIGIAVFPHDAETADTLIKNADTAMYLAKARGRANHQFFTAAMARSALDALVLESQMAQGLERGEFVLHFQPQISASTGQLIGAEALMRWRHPERGLLMPDAFILLAEQQRLMLPLGQWVLRESARCAARWHAAGLRCGAVAVNLSSVQFQANGFPALVQALLAEEGVSGELLELELTERMLMDDLSEVKRKLSELKLQGLRISVDDFGTGYSSLAHLKELPIDKMKIDRSFVRDLPEDTDSTAIAHAIVQMAHSLGLTVMAEGVETPAQQACLTALGCDELQGMLISPPLPVAEFEVWVSARQALAQHV
jgi:diguanylate cyclase (GGDEF)-like protein/PAS domain S-box-containing protein